MKYKSLRSILSLLLIAALALQLAGCAGGPAAPAEPGDEPGSTAALPDPGSSVPVNLLSGVTPNREEPGSVSPEAAAAAADFALRLFRAGNEPERNTLISPLSVLWALAMTANGAEGGTRTQMESTLGLRTDLWNEYFLAYLAALSAADSPLKAANSIWFTADPRFTVNQAFLQTDADFYGADLYQAPFDDATLDAINEWVREKTDGMIPRILDQIPQAAVMYLVNALAFDAEWEVPYQRQDVSAGNFFPANGEKRLVDFLSGTEHLYLEDELATGFIKPYAGGKYAFAALLPREGVSLEDYVNSLDGAAVQKLLSGAEEVTVYTALPKFETQYDTELSNVLKSMGMELPFDEARADFSGLGTSTAGNIYVSRVIHKTFLSVSEEGTRAAAATVVEMADGCALIEDYKTVTLDRPFLYMLIDTETQLPFFLGTMLDPAGEA